LGLNLYTFSDTIIVCIDECGWLSCRPVSPLCTANSILIKFSFCPPNISNKRTAKSAVKNIHCAHWFIKPKMFVKWYIRLFSLWYWVYKDLICYHQKKKKFKKKWKRENYFDHQSKTFLWRKCLHAKIHYRNEYEGKQIDLKDFHQVVI
jgi:hypothetical protein